MTIQEINQQIKILKQKLKTVQGTETEVYSRIVGYYRPVHRFNDGQRSQYNNRLTFKKGIYGNEE